MKANRPPLSLRTALAATLALAVASCAAPPPPPAPRLVPPPRPIYRPPPPPAPVVPAPDWRDRAITPGAWRWSGSGGTSLARFAEGPGDALLEIRCDRASGNVLMIRPGAASDAALTTVTTTSTARAVTARPTGGSNPQLVLAIPARDPLLDAIVFSRGRFAVDTQGLGTLYLPSRPEVARVVEECR
jgi:hypothetical protein